MARYILQKELPYVKAGTIYFLNEGEYVVDKNSYLPDISGRRHERFAIHRDYVEGNLEWFQKEPELQWFVVPTGSDFVADIKGWTPHKQHKGNMGGYADCQYFPDEESAKEFILMNKPVLSLLEVLKGSEFKGRTDFEDNKHFISLKELVKSKL